MTNTTDIIINKTESSFIVKCKDSNFAKELSRKIYSHWDKAMENCKEPGTYAHDLIYSGDLLTCVPCNENLLLWFDIRWGEGYEQKFNLIHEFIKTCISELD